MATPEGGLDYKTGARTLIKGLPNGSLQAAY